MDGTMRKIAIDLLPQEFRAEGVKRAKFYKIQTIGVGTILILTFLASLTIALRVLQSQEIQQIKNKLDLSEQKVTGLKNTQSSLFLLKNRLTTINQYLGVPSNKVSMFDTIEKLLPESISISSFSIDRSGSVLILGTAPDGDSIDNLVSALTSGAGGDQAKISQITVENLSRGRDGLYRFSLKVKPKG